MAQPDEKIEVRCPKCDNRLRFALKFMGRSGLCPLCGASFKIAPAGPAPAAAEPKVEDKESWKISTYFKGPRK